MKVINLYGGPGTGKSTTAAALFAEMKHRGYKVELVTEYAKELCYDGKLQDTRQIEIFFEQERRLKRLRGHVDYAITDSPIMLSLIYHKPTPGQRWFRELVWEVYNEYDNFNVFLQRVKPYQTYGREQNESEARGLDELIRNMPLTVMDCTVDADRHAAVRILCKLEGRELPSGLPAHLIDKNQGIGSLAL